MATFVIVHGAFGGGWEWREVAAVLCARGHTVFTPTLTGFGERVHLASPMTNLETHILDILNLLHYEDLQEVVLACQSYGGMVVTGVADRAPERLRHLIYFNALVPKDGQSVFDLTPSVFMQRFRAATSMGDDDWRLPVPRFEDDPEIATAARGRYVPTPLRPFTERLRLGPPPKGLGRTYIWCTRDQEGLSGVPDMMRPFAERAQQDPNWHVEILDAVTDAHLLMPERVAELFDAAARWPLSGGNAFST